jgi:hypothetical protein
MLEVQTELAVLKNRASHNGCGIRPAPGWNQLTHHRIAEGTRGAVVCPCCDAQVVALLTHPICEHLACSQCWDSLFGGWPTSQSKCTRCSSGCPMCHSNALPLMKSAPCGHRLCEACWVADAERQIPLCHKEFRRGFRCSVPCCKGQIATALRRKLSAASLAIRNFDEEVRKATSIGQTNVCVSGVKLTSSYRLHVEVAESDLDVGLTCCFCQEHHWALLANDNCGHSACESCWTRWAEHNIPRCRDERRNCVHCCISPDCQAVMHAELWRYLCSRSIIVGTLADEARSALGQLAHLSARRAEPLEAGPVCTICRGRHWALIANPSCNHAACEACWSMWAEVQIPNCRSSRKDVARCFAPGCSELIDVPLWRHAAKQSQEVRQFESVPMVARRRRLRQNVLFPAAMQVDCPQADCWGLGYLGHDTVMCFICEHQWEPDNPGEAPADVDVEEVMGIRVKRCPRCKEPIEKNGGCDHMTCKCKHEFWWTTLQPYTR